MNAGEDWEQRLDALGAFIREQRKQARLTLRELSELAQVSNPYLSQIERGLHEPSVRVLRSIAKALDLSAEQLLEQAGLLDGSIVDDSRDSSARAPRVVDTEAVIRADTALTREQRDALVQVYRTYVRSNSGR